MGIRTRPTRSLAQGSFPQVRGLTKLRVGCEWSEWVEMLARPGDQGARACERREWVILVPSALVA